MAVVKIIEEWHCWDGFLEGIVENSNQLYYAKTNDDPLQDAPRRYFAIPLFKYIVVNSRLPEFYFEEGELTR